MQGGLNDLRKGDIVTFLFDAPILNKERLTYVGEVNGRPTFDDYICNKNHSISLHFALVAKLQFFIHNR